MLQNHGDVRITKMVTSTFKAHVVSRWHTC